ncbi:MAG: hypothetical protein U5L96_12110 [Owenweeksia sp.]|nr:hypothetical protein [Owenweeksia sp.]
MEHVNGFDRQQAVLIPTIIDDVIDKKNPCLSRCRVQYDSFVLVKQVA